ncbi:hypothetical protein [Aerosakkonema funiforme]|uniref:Uncharacterized protein n=1 Tax=Aerosakkonema funiforme FACHB-1375 TaxID=2949571 RepID=A0A926ZKQ4_9CYAN|nr:hypothetical protein [Aerosakkonema funiforme]MBD2184236.1 hypothetical protein [Aerosakkonema funiforme FACHB-1375]
MMDFLFAFIWLIVLVWPAQKIITWVASFLHKNLPKNTPILPNLPLQTAKAQIKMKHGYANPKETILAVRSAVTISGIITVLIQWHLLLPVIVWVILICILISFIDVK